MRRVFTYSFKDFIRSWWNILYTLFFLAAAVSFLFLNHDLSKGIVSLMNLVILLCPLIATVFGYMYFFNSQEFTNLLLAQPLSRTSIFAGQYLGLASSLSMSLTVGMGIPFLIYGISVSDQISNFIVLIVVGIALTFIFTAMSFLIAVHSRNRLKGFGMVILYWLFMAVIYDAIVLMLFLKFKEFPLEKMAIATSLLNPIDLGRVLILLKLDISALMNYTGALFNKFFNRDIGMVLSALSLLSWVVLPVWLMLHKAKRRDF